MFAGQLRVDRAHKKEFKEIQARIKAEHELAIAQEQAARRSLWMAKEKAANETKSEFVRVMCHEVRTPLNGCLASAEMLLDTPLQVGFFHVMKDTAGSRTAHPTYHQGQ